MPNFPLLPLLRDYVLGLSERLLASEMTAPYTSARPLSSVFFAIAPFHRVPIVLPMTSTRFGNLFTHLVELSVTASTKNTNALAEKWVFSCFFKFKNKYDVGSDAIRLTLRCL